MDNTDITDEGFTDINEEKKKNLHAYVKKNEKNEKNKNHEDLENYGNDENSPPKWYDTPLSSGATSKSIVSNVSGFKTVQNNDYNKNENHLDIHNNNDNNNGINDNNNNDYHNKYDNNSMSFPEIYQKNENSYPNGPFSPVRPYRAPYLTSPWGQSSEESIEVCSRTFFFSLYFWLGLSVNVGYVQSIFVTLYFGIILVNINIIIIRLRLNVSV